jgi:hypothetical protein
MKQNQTSDAVVRKVWYKIYYSDVTTNREDIDLSSILISPEDDWDDLKRQLVKEIPELDGIHISQLELYKDDEELQQSKRIRSVNQAIGDAVGKSSPLIVMVYPADCKKQRALRIVIKPDSERVHEILIERTKLSANEMHFVNREEPMLALLRVHIEHYVSRHFGPGGARYQFPLMDSLFGMGKSTFASYFLALLERYISQTKSEFPSANPQPGEWDDAVIEAIRSKLYPPTKLPKLPSMVTACLDELRAARTVRIVFGKGALLGDHFTMISTFINESRVAIHETFGLNLAGYTTIASFLAAIPKPVFIVLDEIGRAFLSPNMTNYESRKAFLNFVETVAIPLTDESGVYYLLCGKARFLWDVGVRATGNVPRGTMDAEVLKVDPIDASPGDFIRIHLNPIREARILEILTNTYVETGSVLDYIRRAYQERNLSPREIVAQLYELTGGHPRNLLAALNRPHALRPLPSEVSSLILEDVIEAAKRWPDEIKTYLLDRRFDSDIDLEHEIDLGDRIANVLFLATRIHAGIGDDISSSAIFIMPPVLRYLEAHFVPYVQFIRGIKNDLRSNPVGYPKALQFERVVIKWFQAVFPVDNVRNCRSLLDSFCPHASLLSELILKLDRGREEGGSWILEPGKTPKRGSLTTSAEKVGRLLAGYIGSHWRDMYIPAQMSHSPDILIVPPLEKNFTIIGVQVKCLKQGTTIADTVIKEEVEKFYPILQSARRSLSKPINGVFVMCTTGNYAKEIIPEGAAAAIFKNAKTALTCPEVEILVLNLSTPELREEFFKKGLGNISDIEQVSSTIENLIALGRTI